MGNEVQRRTQLQIVNDKRKELSTGLEKYKQFLEVIPVDKQENFKKNFLELATQDYLLSIIDVKEIIRFAANVTKIGLDIAPSSNEVYIIPFDTKINKQKVMLPQAIIPYNGMQQLAYQSGFMLTVDPVYKFTDDECAAARELTRIQQSKLNTADPEWLDNHFIGYDVVLKDLNGNLGEQTYFVDVSYVKAATKTNKDPRWSLSTWTHKAVRKAYKQFLVPRDRAMEQFEKIEHLNDIELSKVDEGETKMKNFEELQRSLKPLNVELAYENGMAIASGNTFNNAKTMKEIGFKFVNGKYIIDSTAPLSGEVTDVIPENEIQNPLAEFGLDIEEKTSKGKVYQIVKGETLGLDDILTTNGFIKGKTGKWGREKNLFDN